MLTIAPLLVGLMALDAIASDEKQVDINYKLEPFQLSESLREEVSQIIYQYNNFFPFSTKDVLKVDSSITLEQINFYFIVPYSPIEVKVAKYKMDRFNFDNFNFKKEYECVWNDEDVR